ncbi:beta-1 [Tropilaelaps mercedesae]|uniref:Hexosyltransferase n=1 Tax=Tropilaelaps mercedesae TaxID=418985 RepID=A0A1V9X2K0_9ACAR|nr:beta-1 [Tropilaelaps mercedesae]
MAFGLEWRIATRIARRSLQLRPYRLQKTVVGILIVLAVLILSGPASKRKESTDEIRTVRTHLKEISVEEDSPRKFGPRQILSLCRSGHLHTLFFVHTSPDRFHDRKELRSYLHRPPEVAVVFMLGSSDDSNIALRIAQEAELYEDMVVFESFIDSYRNLTLKFVNSIRWIHHKCGNKHSLQNIIKLDDDAWVNFPMLKR